MRTRQVLCCLTGVMGGTTHEENPVWYESVQICSIAAHQRETVWFCLLSVCVILYVTDVYIYMYIYVHNVHACLSAPPPPLAVGDGGAAAQFYDHLLAVVEGPLVSQLLQGAGSVGQHAHPLARSRKKGRRKVAARQHHSLRLLPLARPHLTLLCTRTTHTHTQKQKQLVTVAFRVSFLMSLTSNSQTEFNHWSDI